MEVGLSEIMMKLLRAGRVPFNAFAVSWTRSVDGRASDTQLGLGQELARSDQVEAL